MQYWNKRSCRYDDDDVCRISRWCSNATTPLGGRGLDVQQAHSIMALFVEHIAISILVILAAVVEEEWPFFWTTVLNSKSSESTNARFSNKKGLRRSRTRYSLLCRTDVREYLKYCPNAPPIIKLIYPSCIMLFFSLLCLVFECLVFEIDLS